MGEPNLKPAPRSSLILILHDGCGFPFEASSATIVMTRLWNYIQPRLQSLIIILNIYEAAMTAVARLFVEGSVSMIVCCRLVSLWIFNTDSTPLSLSLSPIAGRGQELAPSI